MKNLVILVSSNIDKEKEVSKILNPYGIEVLREEIVWDKNSEEILNLSDVEILDLVEEKRKEGFLLMAIISEKTSLNLLTGEEVDIPNSEGVEIVHKSTLLAIEVIGTKIQKNQYLYETEGYLDFSKKVQEPVFGWDDIFIEKKSGKSYLELRETFRKVSSRDNSISQFIQNRLTYKKGVDLNFNEINSPEVIIFDTDKVLDRNFLLNNRSLSKGKINLNPILNTVLESGIFFRSSKNRPQKNYWFPGMNAGIPFTPKKDSYHEATFLFHDLMHFLNPDLIINSTDKKYKNLYIIHRMMGEAFSLVFADMLYVDSLFRSHFPYDWNKRKIYPLYDQATRKGVSIKEILYYNSQYVCLGNSEGFEAVITPEVWNSYKEKYEPFFVSDLIWTERNYQNIISQELDWTKDIGNLNLPNTYTVEEFYKNHESEIQEIGFFETCFNHYMKTFQDAMFDSKPKNPVPPIAKVRYFFGQSVIFSRIKSQECKDIFHTLSLKLSELRSNYSQELELEIGNEIRSNYKMLLDKNYISQEQYNSWVEIYPIFEPFYVTYDDGFENYPSLNSLVNQILK